jgi:hypothetical protein
MRIADLRRHISYRASVLRLLSGFTLDRSTAERQAAKELADEERARSKPSTASASATAEPTVHNARAVLLARIDAVAERLRNGPRRRNRLPRAAPPTVIRPHIEDPIIAQPAPAAAPSGELQVIGVFAGRISTAQLIDDSEFDPRWKESIATRNWRASIERNQKLRGRFIG